MGKTLMDSYSWKRAFSNLTEKRDRPSCHYIGRLTESLPNRNVWIVVYQIGLLNPDYETLVLTRGSRFFTEANLDAAVAAVKKAQAHYGITEEDQMFLKMHQRGVKSDGKL
jgi:hypothetical protein